MPESTVPFPTVGRRIAVIGTGITGLATVRVLMREGAAVTLYDTRPADAIGDEVLAEAKALGCELRLATSDSLATHDLVVTSPGVAIGDPFFRPAWDAGIEVVAEVELAYRMWPGITLVAITGTNGKSTTTALTGAMLEQAGRRVCVSGNIGSPLIEDVATTPAEERDDTVFVTEVSSFQLEACRHFHPRAAALLNVTDDHADRHPTPGEYLSAKARVFATQTGDDTAVLNWEDPSCRSLEAQLAAAVSHFSATSHVRRGTCIRGGEILYIDGESREVLCATARIRLVGRHNLENVLASSVLAISMGCSGTDVRAALETFEPAPHTFRLVGSAGGVRFVNDSKGTNVAATASGLAGLDAPAVLIAGGSDKGADFAPLADALVAGARALVVLGDTADRIAEAAEAAGFGPVIRANGMEEAVELAFSAAHRGDYVVLSPACASFDMFANYRERGRVFEGAVARLPGFVPLDRDR